MSTLSASEKATVERRLREAWDDYQEARNLLELAGQMFNEEVEAAIERDEFNVHSVAEHLSKYTEAPISHQGLYQRLRRARRRNGA